jgi:hypothetical protein
VEAAGEPPFCSRRHELAPFDGDNSVNLVDRGPNDPWPAVHDVRFAVCGEDRVAPVCAEEPIRPGTAVEPIVSRSAVEDVMASTSQDDVVRRFLLACARGDAARGRPVALPRARSFPLGCRLSG